MLAASHVPVLIHRVVVLVVLLAAGMALGADLTDIELSAILSTADARRLTARDRWAQQQYGQAAEIYRTLMREVPSPEVREFRQEYVTRCALLQQRHVDVAEVETPAVLTQAADPLLAADALFANHNTDEAAARYREVVSDARAPLGRRLDAWSGLLDTAPDAALTAATAIMRDIEQGTPAMRGRFAPWLGWQLWRAVMPSLSAPPGGVLLGPPVAAPRRISEAPNWQDRSQALMERVVAADPTAAFRPDPRRRQSSLRLAMAMLYTVNRASEQAAATLQRRIEYQLPPLPGTDMPIQGVSPRMGEIATLVRTMSDLLGREAKQAAGMIPLTILLADGMAGEANVAQPIAARTAQAEQLSALVIAHIAAQERVAAGTDGEEAPRDPASLARLTAAVRASLASDEIAAHGDRLAPGVIQAMTATADAGLLDGLYALLTATLDRYHAVTGDRAIYATQSAALAGKVNANPQFAYLKPYLQRLQGRN